MCAKQTNWYLRKPDGSEYGPVTTSELLRWATQSRIVAGNGVSADRETWQKVEDIPELEMDWLAQRPDGREYGPFNIAATSELFEHDVLPADAVLTHRSTHKSVTVETVLNEKELFAEDKVPESPPDEPAPDEKPAAKRNKAKTKVKEAAEKDVEQAVEQAVEEVAEEPAEDSAEETKAEETKAELEKAPDEPLPDEATEAEPEAPEAPEDSAPKSNPELDALRTQAEKLAAKLDKARTELRQARKDLAQEQTQAEKAAAELTSEHNRAQKALDASQKETELLTANLATAQAALDEANGARKQAESKLARLDTERSEAEEQAIQSTAELRKQTAFMKKNIATLQSELAAMRTNSAARGRAIAVILTLLFLVGGAFLLFGLPSCESPQTAAKPGKQPPTSSPHKPQSTPHTPQPTVHSPQPTPHSPQSTAHSPQSTSPLAPWPEIMVEGVKVTPENNICTMRFDAGVFTSLTTPSATAVVQLTAIADSVRQQMDRFQLIVEGHTDDKPLKPTASYNGNYALGLARAETVRKLLITNGKLPGNAIRAVSAGEGKAPYPNDTTANRKRNRTVLLKLVRK